MRHTLPVLAATAFVALATPASAAVVIFDSAGPVQPEENVLFQTNNQTGTSVTGVTNQTNTSVTFSSDESLTALQSQGQARIAAMDGSLDFLTVSLTDPLLTFTEFEANLFGTLQGTGQVVFTLSSGLVQTFDLGNGSNFFGIRATDGDTLTSVSFQTNGLGLRDVRQVRIGGIASPMAAVPEPATWAMMLFGFFGLGSAMRRRKTKHNVSVSYA